MKMRSPTIVKKVVFPLHKIRLFLLEIVASKYPCMLVYERVEKKYYRDIICWASFMSVYLDFTINNLMRFQFQIFEKKISYAYMIFCVLYEYIDGYLNCERAHTHTHDTIYIN
jgi:hypothetical protein